MIVLNFKIAQWITSILDKNGKLVEVASSSNKDQIVTNTSPNAFEIQETQLR